MSKFGTIPPKPTIGFGKKKDVESTQGFGKSGGGGEDGKIYCNDHCYFNLVFEYWQDVDDKYNGPGAGSWELMISEYKNKVCSLLDEPPKEEVTRNECAGQRGGDGLLNCWIIYNLKLTNMGKDRPDPIETGGYKDCWKFDIEPGKCCHSRTKCKINMDYDGLTGNLTSNNTSQESECQEIFLCRDLETPHQRGPTGVNAPQIPKWVLDFVEYELLDRIIKPAEEMMNDVYDDCFVPFQGSKKDCWDEKVTAIVCPQLEFAANKLAEDRSCKIQGGY